MDTALIIHFATALFAILNPLGNLPLYVSATHGERPEVRRYIALFLVAFVLAMLLLFYWSGQGILDFFGVPLPAFQIAGGLILLLNGLAMVRGDEGSKVAAMADKVAERGDLAEAESAFKRLLIPLGIPVMVGPGSLSTVILFSGRAHGFADDLGMSVVIAGMALLTLILLVLSQPLTRFLGEMGLDIAARLMGLILASMGVTFMLEGINAITHAGWLVP